MPHAYADGVHHALTALTYAAGLLTVLVLVTALAVLSWLTLDPAYRWAGARITTWRYRRTHARSGRTPGPQ